MNEKALSEGTPPKNRSKGHLAEPDNQSDKAIIYPNVSHLTGMMPNRKLEKRLYRMIPLIGLIYKSFGRNKAECMKALENSEKEIIALLNTQEQKNPDML